MYMKRTKAWVLVATSLEKGKMIRRGTEGKCCRHAYLHDSRCLFRFLMGKVLDGNVVEKS